MEIRLLREGDAQAWWDLRLESLEREPFAFSKAVDEHRATPVAEIARRFREGGPGTIQLGAFEDGRMVGMVTFMREQGPKERHKGRIYAVYVSEAARGQGIGRALIARVVEMAREDGTLEQILISVAASQEAARGLYGSFGFEVFGREPRAMKVGAEYVDEEHMILRVR